MADIREKLRSSGFKFKHSLGQNFIFSDTLLKRIVNAAEITRDDYVVEVGAGAGSLTAQLCAAARHVSAVEIDASLKSILYATVAEYQNVDIIIGDIMKYDIMKFAQPRGISVVANLPYYITTPVIMRFLESPLSLNTMTVMVQREVGRRICAAPNTKDYGALTIAVQYRMDAQIVMNVSAGNFTPRPDVDSCVVHMRKLNESRVKPIDENLFFKVVKSAFAMRRKTMVNNLIASLALPRDNALSAMRTAGLKDGVRGEALSIQDFIKLSDVIYAQEYTVEEQY